MQAQPPGAPRPAWGSGQVATGAVQRMLGGLFAPPPLPALNPAVERFDTVHDPSDWEEYEGQCFANAAAQCVTTAYNQFIAGCRGWAGLKYSNLVDMYNDPLRQAFCLPHVGNAIEERTYQLMAHPLAGRAWDDQDTTVLGPGTRPDISVKLSSGKYALYDITSARGHIGDKSPKWTNKKHVVYVAELIFPSVSWLQLVTVMGLVATGGTTLARARQRIKQLEEARKRREAKRETKNKYVRTAFRQDFGNFKGFAATVFGGDSGEASAFLHAHGVRGKGIPKPSKLGMRRFAHFKNMSLANVKQMF